MGGRKISGTGAGEIEDCIVFVGNLIVDFNYEMMCRVLKVPDEKFRDKVHKSPIQSHHHRVHKAKGGLIRADFEVFDGCFREVAISGDFFCYPKTPSPLWSRRWREDRSGRLERA